MLRLARHSMLALSIVALLACLMILNSFRGLDRLDQTKFPATAVTPRIAGVDDPVKLKQLCVVLATALDKEFDQNRKDVEDVEDLIRQHLKVALAFSCIACVVLLLGWAAAGRTQKSK